MKKQTTKKVVKRKEYETDKTVDQLKDGTMKNNTQKNHERERLKQEVKDIEGKIAALYKPKRPYEKKRDKEWDGIRKLQEQAEKIAERFLGKADQWFPTGFDGKCLFDKKSLMEEIRSFKKQLKKDSVVYPMTPKKKKALEGLIKWLETTPLQKKMADQLKKFQQANRESCQYQTKHIDKKEKVLRKQKEELEHKIETIDRVEQVKKEKGNKNFTKVRIEVDAPTYTTFIYKMDNKAVRKAIEKYNKENEANLQYGDDFDDETTAELMKLEPALQEKKDNDEYFFSFYAVRGYDGEKEEATRYQVFVDGETAYGYTNTSLKGYEDIPDDERGEAFQDMDSGEEGELYIPFKKLMKNPLKKGDYFGVLGDFNKRANLSCEFEIKGKFDPKKIRWIFVEIPTDFATKEMEEVSGYFLGIAYGNEKRDWTVDCDVHCAGCQMELRTFKDKYSL